MRLIFLAPLVLLFSCVNLPQSDHEGPRPQIRDVPQVIRGVEIDGPRQRMVVLPVLDANDTHPENLKLSLEAFIIEQLALTKQVVLIQPKDIGVSLAEYRSDTGYKMDLLGSKAREAGVSHLLEVVIEKITIKRKADSVGLVRSINSEIEALLKLRLVQTKTGKVVLQEQRVASSEDSRYRIAQTRETDRLVGHSPYVIEELLQNMVYELLPQVLGSLLTQSWEGRIAMVKGDRLYLNVGRLSGLEMGDVLRVSEAGEQVFDPDTGVLIGEVSGRMKGTLEVIGYFGTDGAVAIVHSGSGFQENDKIELY